MGLRIAVVGATGNVGREMLDILAERKFPVDEVFALASNRSAGNTIQLGNKELVVEDLNEFDFSNADIALFSAGGKISGEFAPKAAEKNCRVSGKMDNAEYQAERLLTIPVHQYLNSEHMEYIINCVYEFYN